MSEKCLVTGSTAVLGSALKELVKKEESTQKQKKIEFIFIGSRECDLTNIHNCRSFFKINNFTKIIHLAAISGGMGLSGKSFQATLLYKNLTMLMNILELAKEFNIKKTLLTLSAGMYSPDLKMPYKEDGIHKGDAHEGLYGYYYAKRMMEPALKAYRDQYNLNIIGLVPNGIYGKNDNFDLKGAPLVPALIRRFIEAKENKSVINIWGDGSALREWTYSEDMARAFLWCFENYDSENILNVGSTEENTVREISYLVSEIIGFDKKKILFDNSKPSGVLKKSTDNSNFVRLSNFKYTPFREGLKKTIDWYIETRKNNPEILRIHSKA
jgi:GDP-L-fucose synthase